MNSLRILVVDDEPIIRETLAEWLSRLGATTVSVADTRSADAELEQVDYDLLLSDVHLPGNQGLRWISQVLARRNAPAVLLMTGNPELESAVRAANLPVAGYLLKPVDFAQLRQQLEQAQKRKQCLLEIAQLSRDLSATLRPEAPAAAEMPPPLRDLLGRLADALAHHASSSGRSRPSHPPWRALVVETITVLEKTKHSFRSRDLGELRRRLQQAIDDGVDKKP